MTRIVSLFRSLFRWIATPVRLVREGQDDVDRTYPDHWRAEGEEAALQGAVTSNLVNPGGLGGR